MVKLSLPSTSTKMVTVAQGLFRKQDLICKGILGSSDYRYQILPQFGPTFLFFIL